MVRQHRQIQAANPPPLTGNEAGSTTVEFAFLAPIFFTMLIGIWDIGQLIYANAVLRGVVEAAARNTTLETGDTTAADTLVSDSISPVLPGAVTVSSRLSYNDFTDIGRPEPFNDSNTNGTCDNSESYTDQNGNGHWDVDVGLSGNGSASDVIVYTVNVDYTPIFKIPYAPDMWNSRRLTAVAVRKNQPYATQGSYGTEARTCA